MTRIAYLDPFAGTSGDMLLGALLDAGWPLEALQTLVDSLGIPGVTVFAARVEKRGLVGTHVRVNAPESQPLRHPADLLTIIDRADALPSVRARAAAVITRLAEAEARVHGLAVEDVHFHEIGAVDTLVDVLGGVAGLAALGVEQIVSAPLPWSGGTVRIAHGVFPVPPPAVAVLLEGFPVTGVDVQGEMVTPTGAALITGLAESFGLPPDMIVRRVAYGAGTRDWPDRPNLLRLVLGDAVDGAADAVVTETLTVLACNLDDMLPQWYGPLVEAALRAGALDVWLTPAHMKKNRPAVIVEVLCRPMDAARLRDLLFRQTTTLGVREYSVIRRALPREMRTVHTPYGEVRIKIGYPQNGSPKFAPEHDDCVARASEHGVSVREVWLAAVQAARQAM
ncbi:MAG: nickel pincer cofactor biosynthesis protein LarC [Anaerolineae bacterium]|nr:nickel pincer cofactor biosynthesis protein LarC [Anaerolineae bacterium]